MNRHDLTTTKRSIGTAPRRIRRGLLGVVLAAFFVPAAGPIATGAAGANSASTNRRSRPISDVERVTWVTGPESPNHTDQRWNVYGTDLGHPLVHDDALYLVFGDTWGRTGSEGSDWRSNTMAKLESPDPRDGFHIATMITDDAGAAAELLPSIKRDHVEKTVIPTHGISIDGRMVLHFMSVRTWNEDGAWEVGHAGFASSIDDGATWTIHDAQLPADFAQVAMVRDGDHVLLYGLPAGRSGGVHLARAAVDALLFPESYEYWSGTGWTSDPAQRTQIVPPAVGELSVQWSDWAGRWLMMYLDRELRAVVLRTAPQPEGPWGNEVVVAAGEDYPELYAPYIVPGVTSVELGPDLYFTMSQFGPYQVSLMRVGLPSLGVTASRTIR